MVYDIMLTIFGSMVLDTIHTPDHTSPKVLGGSSTYAALAASHFTKTNLVAVAGSDLPELYVDLLSNMVDTAGLQIREGQTFRYEARYENNFQDRVDVLVEPNVSLDYQPPVPEQYRKSEFVYLANADPQQQITILRQFDAPKFVMCDTIQHWIEAVPNKIIELLQMVDAVIINEGEARLLADEYDLARCADMIHGWGAKYVIIKKAEHGSLLFHNNHTYSLPGFPIKRLKDPTGAGDSFAGAVMGYLDSIDTINIESLRRACIYGNVVGSFTVEQYHIEGLLNLGHADIERRIKEYHSITGMNADRLVEIFTLQKRLASMMDSARYPSNHTERVAVLCTAIIHEAVELQRLTNWKWWKKPTEFDLKAAHEELADIWHFVVQASIELGMSPQDILDEYIQKNQINIQRQKSGY
ncbi:MAG: sugar kinase [Cenarchaeum sp. SB0662_bin_33]|nr:sugar kinase [Cenarchaeum sp. SB0664_bin_35]MYB46474.1 sugar kinase [Cenarchaeum sp. SB0662_bin_33]